jgi:hypothetical protein
MPTTINADNGVVSGSAGLKTTADSSGVLALQSSGTTGLTLNTSLALGVGSSPSFGTSGQVLTSAGTGAAPTWSTVTVSGSGGTTASGSVTLTSSSAGAQYITPTTFGQSVTLPDATTMTKAAVLFVITNNSAYDLKIKDASGALEGFIPANKTVTVGLADNSTSAGTWILQGATQLGVGAQTNIAYAQSGLSLQTVNLDTDQDFYFIFGVDAYGIVYNKATNTWGSLTLIRGSSSASQGVAIKTTTDQVFVATSIANTVSCQGVVLSISGTTITVGTAVTTTALTGNASFNAATNPQCIALIGTTSVALAASNTDIRCFSISGTTVTVGARVVPPTNYTFIRLATGSSTVAIIYTDAPSIPAWGIAGLTISGTTGSLSGHETFSVGVYNFSGVYAAPLGSRFVLIALNSAASGYAVYLTRFTTGAITSVSSTLTSANIIRAVKIGTDKLIIFGPTNVSQNSCSVWMMYDNAGTPSISSQTLTYASFVGTGCSIWQSGTTQASIWVNGTGGIGVFNVDASGTTLTTAPVLSYTAKLPSSTIYLATPFAISASSQFGTPALLTGQNTLYARYTDTDTSSTGTYSYRSNGFSINPPTNTGVYTISSVNPNGTSAALVGPTTTTIAGIITVVEVAQ